MYCLHITWELFKPFSVSASESHASELTMTTVRMSYGFHT